MAKEAVIETSLRNEISNLMYKKQRLAVRKFSRAQPAFVPLREKPFF